jgi:hypothetical protein
MVLKLNLGMGRKMMKNCTNWNQFYLRLLKIIVKMSENFLEIYRKKQNC